MPSLPILTEREDEYNTVVSHPLQSYEWGEFREKTGVKVIRRGFEEGGKLVEGFQLTIHKIPHTSFSIGYLPKGNMPTKKIIEELRKIGKEENCIFIQLEPNIVKSQISNHKSQINSKNQNISNLDTLNLFDAWNLQFGTSKLVPSAHPIFTKYTFVLDLTKSEEELLKNMHSKTRYNIRVAEKKGVSVKEDDTDQAFKMYLLLTQETTTRQKFYAHTQTYHKLMWQTLKPIVIANEVKQSHTDKIATSHSAPRNDKLVAHLLTATYQNKILTTWIVFVFHDTLYYPYGASSSEHREVMANNLMMWEAIKFGKKLGLNKFDMWGALSKNPIPNDPWFGFHRFKSGYGATHTEFVGSYDLVISPALYKLYKVADKLRWLYLRLKK